MGAEGGAGTEGPATVMRDDEGLTSGCSEALSTATPPRRALLRVLFGFSTETSAARLRFAFTTGPVASLSAESVVLL